ncbi:MAG TPA: hypothetical protein VL485_09815 [Ktedonobacteraceae bacterium]|jgi:tetratricopeptide (TPR) repeat protein|nr:hypothetical protein [Ktedonobacteraceae bacterium]
MIDSPYLLPFDLFQQLVIWLGTSMHTYRRGRRFLESNQVLLRTEIERELERLITAHVEEKVEMKQQMQYHQELLRTAKRRGGTSTAIREAYINVYGGFALDLPNWLEVIEQQRAQLHRLRRPERTTRTHIQLLRQALAHAQLDTEVAPEIVAELSNELGYMLLQGPLPLKHSDHLHLLQEAIASHEAALAIYTYARYPLQYARTCIYLGAALQRYGYILDSQEEIEKALGYYKSALWIYTRNEYPEQWSMLQTLMGNVYALRHAGGVQDNLNYATFCHESALQALQEDVYPEVWARTQVNLGDTYQLRQDNDLFTHLSRALVCYRTALHVYSQQEFPHEWADIHTKLATVFQKLAGTNEQQHDISLSCSIVCCEAALKVYTIDAYPVEYAATQYCLGQAHHQRYADKHLSYLKQAIACYQEALQLFTSENFPVEHQQAASRLDEAKATYLVASQYTEVCL